MEASFAPFADSVGVHGAAKAKKLAVPAAASGGSAASSQQHMHVQASAEPGAMACGAPMGLVDQSEGCAADDMQTEGAEPRASDPDFNSLPARNAAGISGQVAVKVEEEAQVSGAGAGAVEPGYGARPAGARAEARVGSPSKDHHSGISEDGDDDDLSTEGEAATAGAGSAVSTRCVWGLGG